MLKNQFRRPLPTQSRRVQSRRPSPTKTKRPPPTQSRRTQSRRESPQSTYVPYLELKIRNDPRYVERLMPAVLNWDEFRNNVAKKEKINEEKFRNAYYKAKALGNFNREEFVSAFRHAEARGNVNVNKFVKHYKRRRTYKNTRHNVNLNAVDSSPRTKNISL
jgi:hypothetical protein